MTTTRQLPTDKHGNVYYGPRTFRRAQNLIWEADDTYDEAKQQTIALRVSTMLDKAGYTGDARRIRRHFGV